jgi:hypothetical protein
MVLHRTQILLEPDQHRALTQIARVRGSSLSEVVRQIVQAELDRQRDDNRRKWDRRMEIIREAREENERYIAEHGPLPPFDVVAELEAARAERDDRVLGIFPETDD